MVMVALLGCIQTIVEPTRGETLTNGIVLSQPWPPRIEKLAYEPMPLPYLTNRPAIIPIDAGRQLFVDDYLIESTTLKRAWHSAEYFTNNPVLKPDKPWEMTGENPCAMVFSDGVWFDPADRLFKMWYMGGYTKATCYATSTNGIDWEKPSLDVVKDTNIVQPDGRDSATVWLDQAETDPKRRFKMFRVGRAGDGWRMSVYFSADGIHWGEPLVTSGPCGDRSTVFYNPFRKAWVYSLRSDSPFGRARSYVENADVLAGANWKEGEPRQWTSADRLDATRGDLKTRPELYNLDAFPYENLMVGLFSIWRGQPKDRPKPNEILIGFSRDGFHWDRANRAPFIPVSEKQGDWNWGNVQSAGGGCLVVGRKLHFYVSGRAGVPGTSQSGACVTSLATLRRDGFASMDAGQQEGVLTTRLVRFNGRALFANVDCPNGELRVEVLDEHDRVIKLKDQTGQLFALDRERCTPVKTDSTLISVNWQGIPNLTALADRPVKFRFYLTNGKLYAFWVSRFVSGASTGYVAAGGPHFTGPTDTIGTLSYRPIGATNTTTKASAPKVVLPSPAPK